MRKLSWCALGIAIASPASANDCDAYVGTSPKTYTIQEALAFLPNLKPKGEFETTAEYEARRSAATPSFPSPLIITKPATREVLSKSILAKLMQYGVTPESLSQPPTHFDYDADTQTFTLRYASVFSSDANGLMSGAFNAGSPYSERSYQIGVQGEVIESINEILRTYVAENAYGAKTEVEVEETNRYGIVQSLKRRGLFRKKDLDQFKISVPRNEAENFKTNAKVAYLVEPKDPWGFSFKAAPRGPTRDSPTETTVIYHVLMADFRCGFVLAPDGQVVKALPTID